MQFKYNKLKTNSKNCFVYLQLSYVERCETCFQYHKNFSNYNGVQCYTHARKFAHSIRLKLMFLFFFSLRFYFAIAKYDVCVHVLERLCVMNLQLCVCGYACMVRRFECVVVRYFCICICRI